jgi:putative DNA primase/helicase
MTADIVSLTPDDVAPPFSEEAMALDFAQRHADDLRYVDEWKRWMVWDGHLWRFDKKRQSFSFAREICRETALHVNHPKEGKAVASAKSRAAVVSLASEDHRLVATIDQWDADPWLLNTPGGVVDLRTGAIREVRRTDYMTKSTAVAPGDGCPLWNKFLDRVTVGNKDLKKFLLRMGGYFLTGLTIEQSLFFLFGLGSNGKGVFINTISGLMGDYHTVTAMETLTASNTDRHPTELAALRGARLVTANETEDGRQWAEARIKQLTGEDEIAARFMRQDFFHYKPQFKLLISGNHKPGLRSVNEAIKRRTKLIPFDETIPEAERDLKLTEKLKAEWPGILQLMINGCLEWQKEGLKPPQCVLDATEEYLVSEDSFQRWLDECCRLGPNEWMSVANLFTCWKMWAEANGEIVGTARRFSQTLETRGFKRARSKDTQSKRGFNGLTIYLAAEPPEGKRIYDGESF